MNTQPHRSTAVTLIPPHRCSSLTPIEFRMSASNAVRCRRTTFAGDTAVEQSDYEVFQDRFTTVRQTPSHHGRLTFLFDFFDAEGKVVEHHRIGYQVVDSGVRSTQRVDGCWVSIAHWSEDEARHFNADLKKLAYADWKDQIRAMNAAGINSVLIQNVFDSERYAGRHDMTADTYVGRAFYPSQLYADRYPLACEDPVGAILEAADECGMTVFLGVGLFAWFDFSPASLVWHKRVTQELFDLYGHHPSLYAWYVSEEMFGSLYEEWPDLPTEAYRNVVTFFRDYQAFVRELTPTKPIALAPNNIRFHEFANEWSEILPYIDILIPFAFARDLENLNIREIQDICDRSGTHFWVDMEMFTFPLDNGLVPKPIDELLTEIRIYDAVEQIFGYQFTGIMNLPNSPHNLGGSRAKQLYSDYLEHLGVLSA